MPAGTAGTATTFSFNQNHHTLPRLGTKHHECTGNLESLIVGT